MMCERPYCKTPSGVSRVDKIFDQGARMAVTPFGCGRCLPCRINKSREYQQRILLESSDWKDCAFVSLDYKDAWLPYEINKDDLDRWLRKLRKLTGKKFKYFAVGEYGEPEKGIRLFNPHWHIIVFGLCFYNNAIDFGKAWIFHGEQIGRVVVGDVTKDSARYVTGYVTKNMYWKGEERLEGRKPEKMFCSKGLGKKAVQRLAKKHMQIKGKTIPYQLQYGKRKFPLGRYLTNAWIEAQGQDDSLKELKLLKYQMDLDNEVSKAEGETYYDRLIDLKSAKRISQKRRYEIFGRRNKIQKRVAQKKPYGPLYSMERLDRHLRTVKEVRT